MRNSPKLKVGLVFDDSLDSNDGVAQHVKALGRWLSEQGHQVRYLVGETKLDSWSGGRIYSLSKNLPVKFNGNKLSIPLPARKKLIKEVLAKENFDVLHVMMPHSPFMAQKVVKAAGRQTAIIGTFHIFPAGWAAKAGGKLLRVSYGRSLKRFGSIVSVSSAAAGYAKQTFDISSEIVPNPVNVGEFSNSRQKPKPNQIVFLGRLVKRKGCAQLLEAFAVLAEKMPDAQLIIAGDGPQRTELEAKARKFGLENKVKFLGYIQEQTKPDLLAGAGIACFPSLYGESFGIVLIEAMAAGAGVVLGGDNPGYRSVLGRQPKLLVDPNDKQIFADRLLELLSDKSLSDKLHAWQQQTVAQYDIDKVGNQILSIYYAAIARHPKTRHN